MVRAVNVARAHRNRGDSSGERLEISLHAPQATGVDKKLNVIADPWKAVGLQVSFNVVPPAQYSDLEYRAKTTGAGAATPFAVAPEAAHAPESQRIVGECFGAGTFLLEEDGCRLAEWIERST